MGKTIFSIIILIIFGVVAGFLSVFVLNIAGLPGALLAGKPGERSKAHFKFGASVAALGQSYVYLAYTAFIVNWTLRANMRDDVIWGFILWPIALAVVMVPLYNNFIRAREEARESGFAHPQVEALFYTLVVTFVAFFLFAFLPNAMMPWRWIPYIKVGQPNK